MRRIWKGVKLTVGLLLAAPLALIGIVAYTVDQGCDKAINSLAAWAKK